VRYPKTPIGADLPAVRRVGDVDVLSEPDPESNVDVLIVGVGAMATDALEAASAVSQAGYTTRVVAPRWVNPIDAALVGFTERAALVVTVEDGVVVGGVGSRLSQTLRAAGRDLPTREIGIPVRFLEHGSVADVRTSVGFTVQGIGRQIVEWAATASAGGSDGDTTDVPAEDRARGFGRN
jgi:1-deoxy-D-xylulose-5-phosphate synthase